VTKNIYAYLNTEDWVETDRNKPHNRLFFFIAR